MLRIGSCKRNSYGPIADKWNIAVLADNGDSCGVNEVHVVFDIIACCEREKVNCLIMQMSNNSAQIKYLSI